MTGRFFVVAKLAVGMGLAVACGSAPRPNNVKEKTVAAEEPKPSSVTTSREEVEAFTPTSGPGDAPTPYVRDERSSRLAAPLPRGRAKEEWSAPHGIKPSFVLVAGNRYAVTGADAWVLFDGRGNRVDGGKKEANVRLDRASGAIINDDSRAIDLPPDAKVAVRNGLAVMVKSGAVYIGERAIEGKFEAFDVAIDESDVACVAVQQKNELSLWTVPIASSAGIGRQRIGGRAHRVLAPPVLGKNLRVLVLDTGIVALGLDGKRVWERKRVPTGGVTITSDDHVLIADNAKVIAVDPRGKTKDLWVGKDVIILTPPVVTATGSLLVASSELLHVISFA